MSLYDPAHSQSQSSLCLRSRRLLRDTLLKDQSLRDDCNHSTASLPLPATTSASMALASPPSTPNKLGLSPAPRSEYSSSRPHHHYQSVSHSPSSSPMRPTTRAERHRATESYSSPTSMPRRPHTATHTRDHSRSPLSNTTDHIQHPHLVTPHEQVLRTRLERVLFSAGVADDTSKRRERDMERGRTRSPSAGAGFGATSANGSTRTIKRTRANTDSNTPLPPPSSSHFLRLAASSPSSKQPSRSASLVRQKTRTSTGRSIGSGSTSCSGSAGKRSATGTTPPLVPDDEDHDEGREPRLLLLTPPATPSPPGYGFYQAGEWRYKSQCYTGDEESDDDEDAEDDESCSSSYSSYREGSSISSSALHSSVVYTTHQHPLQLRTPTSPQSKIPSHSPHTPLRPFNARRASLQCRAMDGYVSFANVEGLGVPPDEPASPHPEKGGKGVLTALGWGGGVVRKILGGGAEKAEDAPGVVY